MFIINVQRDGWRARPRNFEGKECTGNDEGARYRGGRPQ